VRFAELTTEVTLRDASVRRTDCGCRAHRSGACARLELARQRAGADAFLVRREPSLRRRAAPWHRHRSATGGRGHRADLGVGRLRRNCPAPEQDRHDRDDGRVLGHARAPGLVRGWAWRGRRGRGGRRRGWSDGRRRATGALRPSRRPQNWRRAGLRRSALAPAGRGGEPDSSATAQRDPGASEIHAFDGTGYGGGERVAAGCGGYAAGRSDARGRCAFDHPVRRAARHPTC